MKFTIPIPEKVSLNKIYAGIHFRQRQRHKEAYHMAVLSAGLSAWDGEYPVKMHYHFRIKGSRLDVSNHAYMLKMVEDGLVTAGVLPGDEPKYVSDIRVTAEKIGKDEFDEVEITISAE